MPKPTKVRILEYLYTVSSIPRKQLKLAFQDVAYNTVFRATKELLDSGYIELLSVSKGPTRIKITKAGMDYLSKQKDAVMQANIRSTVTSSSKKERIERVQKTIDMCVASGIKTSQTSNISFSIFSQKEQDEDTVIEFSNLFVDEAVFFRADEITKTIKTENTFGEEITQTQSRVTGLIINKNGLWFVYHSLVSFTTQQMVQSADKGVVDGLVMEYQSYQNDPTLQRNYEFIPFGVRHDNPLYSIGNISAEKKEVIAAFVSLCTQNQAEATKDGFNGLDDYTYTGKVYDGNTIAQAQSVWKEEKDSGIPIVAEFVVDTSGSMRGEPINALKTAMINTIQYINDDNYIGIIGFDSDVREYLPIDQFSLTQKTLYKGAVNSLDANGNTAMYNGLCVAMDRIYKKSQELGGNCTPIIFVLTDGDSNTGYKFSETKDIIAGMNIPIYTISYNYAADSLSELASINEAASIVGNSEDITYKLRNLFNAEM